MKIGFCLSNDSFSKSFTSGTVHGCKTSSILLDIGCNCIVVADELLPDVDVEKCCKIRICDYLGRENFFPKVVSY